MLLRNHVDQSAMEDQDVEKAVVVEIENSASPTHILAAECRYASCSADILETIGSRVAKQSVVFGIADPEIRATVLLDIGKDRSHCRCHLAVLAVGNAQVTGSLLEAAISLVVEQKVLGLIIRDVDVGIAIAVKIRSSHAHSPAFIGGNSRFSAHICERPVAIIVIEAVGVGFVVEWSRVIVGSVVVAVLRIELHISSNE